MINDIMATLSLFFMGIFTRDEVHLFNLINDENKKYMNMVELKKVASYIFDKNKYQNNDKNNIFVFVEFINKIISLSRKDYKKIIEVIRQFYKVLLSININIDLAYSTLVATIEALASKYTDYNTEWEDIDEKLRKNMEKIFKGLGEENSEAIKQVIISNTHAKLSLKYRKYCNDMIEDDYFIEYIIDENNSAKKNELIRAIKSSYECRSKYVHTFKKLGNEISVFWGREICYIDTVPYITLNGLIRLVRYIILKNVKNLNSKEYEQLDYFEELPGILNLNRNNLAPTYWLGNENEYTLDSAIEYINGLLIHLVDFFKGNTNLGYLDLKNVCDKIEVLLKSINGKAKKNIIIFYAIYNEFLHLLDKEYTSENYEEIIEENKEIIDDMDIGSLVYYELLKKESPISKEEIEEIYYKYKVDKYKKKKIQLPTYIETFILIDLLNSYIGEKEKYEYYLSELIGENPGNKYLINKIKKYNDEGIMEKIDYIDDLYKDS